MHVFIAFLFCRLLNVLKAENDRDLYLIFEYMGVCFMVSMIFSFNALSLKIIEKQGKLQNIYGYECFGAETDLHAVIRANILEEVHKQVEICF